MPPTDDAHPRRPLQAEKIHPLQYLALLPYDAVASSTLYILFTPQLA
jgi:hypothetical protein